MRFGRSPALAILSSLAVLAALSACRDDNGTNPPFALVRNWSATSSSAQAGNPHNPPAPVCNDADSVIVYTRTTILPGGTLRDDGLGQYVHSIDLVRSSFHRAFGLWPFIQQKKKTAIRHYYLDLSQPVPASGAVALTSSAPNTEPTNGNSGSLHSFYRLDRQTNTVFGPSWIPVGSTVQSDNTQIHVVIGGVEHMLTLGNDNYPPGYCGNFQIVSQAGTTPASITRDSNTHWTVAVARGSIGRLYKRTNAGNWTNLGLYYVNFVNEIATQ